MAVPERAKELLSQRSVLDKTHDEVYVETLSLANDFKILYHYYAEEYGLKDPFAQLFREGMVFCHALCDQMALIEIINNKDPEYVHLSLMAREVNINQRITETSNETVMDGLPALKLFALQTAMQHYYNGKKDKINPKMVGLLEDVKKEDEVYKLYRHLIRGVDDLSNDIISFVAGIHDYEYSGVIYRNLHGLRHSLDQYSRVLVRVFKDYHPDNHRGRMVSRRDYHATFCYSPGHGPINSKEMLWCMDAYEFLSGSYYNCDKKDADESIRNLDISANKRAEIDAYYALKTMIAGLDDDVKSKNYSEDWHFDPTLPDIESLEFTHDLTIDVLIGYMHYYTSIIKEKLSSKDALELTQAVNHYFERYSEALIDSYNESSRLFDASGAHSPQEFRSTMFVPYVFPDKDHALDMIREYAEETDKYDDFCKLEKMLTQKFNGFSLQTTLAIPTESDVSQTRRKQLEKGSRSRGIPQVRRSFLLAHAADYKDTIITFLTEKGVSEAQALSAYRKMVEKGSLPLNKKGSPYMNIEHLEDLASSGLNEEHNLVVIPRLVNDFNARLIDLQRKMMPSDEPIWFVKFKPSDKDAKFVLGV